MEHPRILLTGHHGAALRDRILARPIDPETLWIAPSPLAASQILCRLTLRRGLLRSPRVWTWRDLWREIGVDRPDQPAILSDSARHCVLSTAIDGLRTDGALIRTSALVETLGYRRALLRTFDRWTSRELDPSRPRRRFATEIEREEWSLYRSYRALLSDISGEDDAGYAVWASRLLESRPTLHGRPFRGVVLIEPRLDDLASWRALNVFHQRADSIQVALSGRPGLHTAAGARIDRLLEMGFEESRHEASSGRSSILGFLETRLFDADQADNPPEDSTRGLRILGAPRGEGLALVVAREVRERLNGGLWPDQILILVPRWDDQAERIVETLRSWGISADGSTGRPLTADPAIAALLRAAKLPIDDWDGSQLAGLLRHGQVGSSWPDIDGAQAALAIVESRVFRGRDALRRALSRTEVGPDSRQGRRSMALQVLERLGSRFDGIDTPATWQAHTSRLIRIGAALGLDQPSAERPAIETLFSRLDEAHEVRARLGRGDERIRWETYLQEVERSVRVSSLPEVPPTGASVRVSTVDAAVGARAEVVILANLGEGTFPSHEALDVQARDPDPLKLLEARRQAIAGEMGRFLRVIGSADRALVLAYPTKDEAGVPLNMAGFLDEVRDRLGPEAWNAHARILPRLMPILDEDLAGSPHERRVRAVGLACANPGRETFPALASLSADGTHRDVLHRVAVALRVAHHRHGRRHFGPFDGMLHDRAAIARIAEDFGPSRPAFSASQLETLALCPFQFFLRHVCRVTPNEARGEFDEDWALRGSIVHEALQTLHEQLRDTPGDDAGSLADRVAELAEMVVLRVLDAHDEPLTEVGRGTRLIESRILSKTAIRYARQFAAYLDKNPDAVCSRFEVGFGPTADAQGPCLELGAGPDLIRLQGKIDRIDMFGDGDASRFRIIDYKNGGAPGPADLRKGLALQLPLYAMAVERAILAGQGTEPDSAGYWGLKKDGYKSLVTMTPPEKKPRADHVHWPGLRVGLEGFVVDLVRQLRLARLPVRPRRSDCTTICDYSTVCRIGSMKHVNKICPDEPALEWEE